MKHTCPRCHSSIFTIRPGTATHYASLKCDECDRFIQWLPHPKNHEIYCDENTLIDRLLASGKLNAWERGFTENLKRQKKRTPKPKITIQEIAGRLGIEASESSI